MQFRVLGSLEVADEQGKVLPLGGAGLRRLLAILVLRVNETVSTDHLVDALWGDRPPARARNAVQVQISKLRRSLAGEGEPLPLRTIGDGYLLDLTAGGSTDVSRFEELVARGRAEAAAGRTSEAADTLGAALALWRGDALAEFAFDEFAQPARQRLHEERLVCQEERIDLDLALGRGPELVAEIEQLVDAHPWRERLCRQLMTALYRAGRQTDALRAFQRTRAILIDEVGVEPGPELAAMEARVLAQDPTLAAPLPAPTGGGRASEPGGEPGPGPRPSAGRAPELSAHLGRHEDLSLVGDLLTSRRLVSVTGPGGVGKTRFATELTSRFADRWDGSVWWVELGAWEGPSAVADALNRTFAPLLRPGLGGSPVGGAVVDQVAEAIGRYDLLLVVDNCEHVLEAAGRAVASLLRRCPHLTVLATSRIPLSIGGEVVHQLQPLDAADAVELFLLRAADASTRFSPGDADRATVERICRHLDQLPLAIELAAARTRAFTLDHLAHRLGTPPDTARRAGTVLGVAPGDRPSRHHTLHAAVAWSYDLLFEDEQTLLARLSVFAGGFSLEGAEAVCAGEGIDVDDVADIVARLVDKSLVVHQPAGVDSIGAAASRYRLLRAVSDFAAERLEEAGATAALRHRHLRWLAELTDGATAGLRGADQHQWLQLLHDEEQNLGRAARWTFDGGDPALGLRIVANLGWYCFVTSRLDDYLDTAQRVLAVAPDAPAVDSIRVVGYAGLLSFGRVDGRGLAARALEEARAEGDPGLLGEMAILRALPLAQTPGVAAEAGALLEEVHAAAAATGDRWLGWYATALSGVAALTDGDPVAGLALLGQASAGLRHLGDLQSAALVDLRRSEVAEEQGDVPGAIAAVEAVLGGIYERSSPVMALMAARRAWFTLRQGRAEEALAMALEARIPDHEPSHRNLRAGSALVLGATSARTHQLDQARACLEPATEFYESFGFAREAAIGHSELGRVELYAGRAGEALLSHRRAIARALEAGGPTTLALCLDGAAETLAAEGHHREAAMAVGAGRARLARAGAQATEAEDRARDLIVAAVARSLGRSAADEATAAGADLDDDGLRWLVPEPATGGGRPA